ncbi:MAG TPA: hypothetical protein ENG38_02555 [Thermoplasmatales archaeon]|nr:hypothetical protein [Thermoplasmatales archaeon]HEX08673.1 hypothetical protein [Thermoplasmatales archaeon]
MDYIFFIFLIALSVGGAILGCLTGLVPGLHVNNIAIILLSLSPFIISLFSFIREGDASLLIAAFITSVALSHTFINILPATFVGAPEEDTALSVLPAHSLLLEGKGYEAIYLSAIGSLGAVIFSFLILYPIRFVLIEPICLYSTLKEIMAWVLIAIVIIMIATEKTKIELFHVRSSKIKNILGMLTALFVFLLSGIFGIILGKLRVESPVGLPAPILFPALSGLFGMPTLIQSYLTRPDIPKQIVEDPVVIEKGKTILSTITGSLAGILVSIIPGITSATGTVLAMTARGEADKRQTIITLSAVNTACTFFVTAVLFMILRPRSGAAIAVNELITVNRWNNLFILPLNLIVLIIAMIISSAVSFNATIFLGKRFAEKFTNIPYQKLIKAAMFLLSFLVTLFTGVIGLLIFILATFIGLIPVSWGVRRSHCMGILLLPIILAFI